MNLHTMTIMVSNKGISAGIRRITRIMRENGWLHVPCRRPHGLTKATTEVQEKENLIKKDFSAEIPFAKLLADISQIPCADGRLYISPIMDCFNGEIIALQMRDNMRKELCVDILKAACDRFPVRGAIIYSDRGSQYTNEAFRKAVKSAGLCQSLSSVDCCYDNARMESFFVTLKKELLYRIPTTKLKMEDVKRIIFRYIFTYYNKVRIYTSNPGGVSPTTYRQQYERNLQTLVA